MTVEVVCPVCESGYVLDEGAAGSEFVCPSCSHTSTIRQDQPEPAVAAARAAPAPRTAIVCPRCNLHFAPEKHKVEIRPGDRGKILIVEDTGYSRDATVEALSLRYDVMTAGTVDAAARILSLGGVDLMVLDPDIDQGFGRRLLQRGAMKQCPIIIYGHDESESYGEAWETSRRQGVDDMVIKGMHAAETLVRKVGALLGHRDDDEDDS